MQPVEGTITRNNRNKEFKSHTVDALLTTQKEFKSGNFTSPSFYFPTELNMNIYYFGVFLVSFLCKSLNFCIIMFLLYFLKFIHIYMTFIHTYIEYIFPNTLLFCFLYCIQIYYSSKKKVLPNEINMQHLIKKACHPLFSIKADASWDL